MTATVIRSRKNKQTNTGSILHTFNAHTSCEVVTLLKDAAVPTFHNKGSCQSQKISFQEHNGGNLIYIFNINSVRRKVW